MSAPTVAGDIIIFPPAALKLLIVGSLLRLTAMPKKDGISPTSAFQKTIAGRERVKLSEHSDAFSVSGS